MAKAQKSNLLFGRLSAPAQRALKAQGIDTLEQLAQYSRKELLLLHGVGKTTIPKLEELLREQGLDFRDDQ